MRLHTFTYITILAALASQGMMTAVSLIPQVFMSLEGKKVVVKWNPDPNDKTGENNIQVVLNGDPQRILGEAKKKSGELSFQLPSDITLDGITSLIVREGDQVLNVKETQEAEQNQAQTKSQMGVDTDNENKEIQVPAEAQEGPHVKDDQATIPLTSSVKETDSGESQQTASSVTKADSNEAQPTSATTRTATAPTPVPTEVIHDKDDEETNSGNHAMSLSISMFAIMAMSIVAHW
ncbi:hypothetical protein IWQ61_007733 [Dispira simplex]|nr:hypothetical protein IWQ61_007733 [Dispira simplex]